MIRIRGRDFNEAEVLPPFLSRLNESIDWLDQRQSVAAIREAVYTAYVDGRLKEAHPASAFGQLLRAGVQTIANDWYTQQPKTWNGYAGSNPSDKFEEVYGPLFGARPMRQVGYGNPALESEIVGDKTILMNLQFGGMESFEEALVEDDQTGQFRQRAQALGTSANTTENFYVAQRFVTLAGTLGDLNVAASTFTSPDITGVQRGPWSKLLYGPALGNRLAAYKALDGAGLKDAKSIARRAVDPLGVKIVINIDTLLISAMDEENAIILTGKDLSGARLSPWMSFQPGTSAQFVGGGSADGGTPGGAIGAAYAANPFAQGLQPVVEKYLPNWLWAIGQKGMGLIMQTRKSPEVVQEIPNSGPHFTSRVIRYAIFSRFEADWIGNRHWVLGNPGELTVDGDAGVAGAF